MKDGEGEKADEGGGGARVTRGDDDADRGLLAVPLPPAPALLPLARRLNGDDD